MSIFYIRIFFLYSVTIKENKKITENTHLQKKKRTGKDKEETLTLAIHSPDLHIHASKIAYQKRKPLPWQQG